MQTSGNENTHCLTSADMTEEKVRSLAINIKKSQQLQKG